MLCDKFGRNYSSSREDKKKMGKVYKTTTLMTTARDSGQILIRKAHWAFGSGEIKQIVSELTCNLSQVFGKSCINWIFVSPCIWPFFSKLGAQ